MRALPALLAAAVVLAAGCSDPTPGQATTEPITVITDPAEGRNGTAEGPHLHDYWGGQDTLTLFEAAAQRAQGYLTIGGASFPVASFRPEPGAVVPQGTARAAATFTWTEEPGNVHGGAELWAKTAADTGPVLVAAIPESGATLTFDVAPAQADLPHQTLSAWQFDLVLLAGPGSTVSYSGDIRLTVTVERGHPIPLFPGHPDRWQGRGELPLLEGGGELLFHGDAEGNFRCLGGCPVVHVPADGAVVPVDATSVAVELGLSGTSPTQLGLKYHRADDRGWTVAVPVTESPTQRSYLLEVGPGGDGPYALQSQWEFLPFIEGPVADSAMRETYTIRAAALR